MADESILNRIEKLVEEEHALQASEVSDARNEEALEHDQQRLGQIQIELDQCWDLLRQRRARREFGENPDEAQVRDADTVERYWQ
jgi:choline kinase